MKTKLTLLLFMTIMMVKGSYGQSPSDTYIIGTSIDIKLNCTGFLKGVGQSDDYYITAPISFVLVSKEKRISIPLVHYNTAHEPRRIVTMEYWKLRVLDAIDAKDFIRNKTKAQADKWGKEHINQTIWVIDRNDFYWEGSTQYMKLIETTITPETYPDPPLIEYIEVEK